MSRIPHARLHSALVVLTGLLVSQAAGQVPAHAARWFDAPLVTQAGEQRMSEEFPFAIAVGDLDGDAVPDLVTSGTSDGCTPSASIHYGLGNGLLTPPLQVVVPNGANFSAIADLDGDGALDIACGSFYGQSVLFGDGSGVQWTRVDLVSIPSVAGLTTGDFDGDGLADLVALNAGGRIQVRLSRPGRQFQVVESILDSLACCYFRSVVPGDLDRDGRVDLVVSQACTYPDVLVLMSLGDGTFTSHALREGLGGGEDARGLTVADINGDHLLDIVIARRIKISIHPGLGDGRFASPTTIRDETRRALEVAVADVDGDGVADLVHSESNAGGVGVHPGLGGGTFGAPRWSMLTRCPAPVSLHDLDGDERLDLVTLGLNDPFPGGPFVALGDGEGRFGRAGLSRPSADAVWLVGTADLDADGHSDLVVTSMTASPDSFAVDALLSRPDRTFVRADRHALRGTAYVAGARQLADIDEDGFLDIALGAEATRLTVLPGRGAGGFDDPYHVELGAACGWDSLADVTGDGHLDIVAASGSTVRVMPGTGDGTFGVAVITDLSDTVKGATVGDINGDGRADLYLMLWSPWYWGSSAKLGLGRSDGGFDVAPAPTGGVLPIGVTIDDANGDGRADLVMVLEETLCEVPWPPLRVRVHLQREDGSLDDGTPSSTVGPRWGGYPHLVDIDGDGLRDLSVRREDELFFARGDGAGHFVAAGGFAGIAGAGWGAIAGFADLDGDGRLDAVLPDIYALTILWGRDPVPPSVALLGPAPLPALVPGAPAHLTWSAADDVGVASIDLFVSRHGARGPFQRIASGLPDTGAFDWPVAGPLSDSVAFKIVARDSAGNVAHATSPALLRIVDPLAADAAPLPARLALAVAPNPARGRCEVRLALPRAGRVTLALHDLQGRRVATLLDAACEPGERRLAWAPAAPLRAGLYFLRLDAIGERRVQRLVVAE